MPCLQEAKRCRILFQFYFSRRRISSSSSSSKSENEKRKRKAKTKNRVRWNRWRCHIAERTSDIVVSYLFGEGQSSICFLVSREIALRVLLSGDLLTAFILGAFRSARILLRDIQRRIAGGCFGRSRNISCRVLNSWILFWRCHHWQYSMRCWC